MAGGEDAKKHDRTRLHQAVMAVLVVALAVLAFFIVPDGARGWDGLRDMLPEVVVACLGFLLVRFWLFKDELEDKATFIDAIADRVGLGERQQLVDDIGERVADRMGKATGVVAMHDTFAEVGWKARLEGATSVHVVGRFGEYWLAETRKPLGDCAARGAELRMCLPDPHGRAELEVMAAQVRPSVKLDMVDRLKARIESTASSASEIGFDVRFTERAINFSWVRIRGPQRRDIVVFAPYDHWANRNVRPSVLVIDLEVERNQAAYLDYEFEMFWTHGTPLASAGDDEPVTTAAAG